MITGLRSKFWRQGLGERVGHLESEKSWCYEGERSWKTEVNGGGVSKGCKPWCKVSLGTYAGEKPKTPVLTPHRGPGAIWLDSASQDTLIMKRKEKAETEFCGAGCKSRGIVWGMVWRQEHCVWQGVKAGHCVGQGVKAGALWGAGCEGQGIESRLCGALPTGHVG